VPIGIERPEECVKAQTSSLAAGIGHCAVSTGLLVTTKTVDVHMYHGSSKGEPEQMGMKKEGWKEGWLASAISVVMPIH